VDYIQISRAMKREIHSPFCKCITEIYR